MNKKRKIALVAKQYSLKEAEEADDHYWSIASVDERLQELIELRKLVFGDLHLPTRIKKVVSRRSIYEQED